MAKWSYDDMPSWCREIANQLGGVQPPRVTAWITRRKQEHRIAADKLMDALSKCCHPRGSTYCNSGTRTDTLGNIRSGWYDVRCGICDASLKYWEHDE